MDIQRDWCISGEKRIVGAASKVQHKRAPHGCECVGDFRVISDSTTGSTSSVSDTSPGGPGTFYHADDNGDEGNEGYEGDEGDEGRGKEKEAEQRWLLEAA